MSDAANISAPNLDLTFETNDVAFHARQAADIAMGTGE